MKLTHPDDIDADTSRPDHPIPVRTVERAHRIIESDISVDEIHTHLETIQTSFEHRLSPPPGLYDPLKLLGNTVHSMKSLTTDSQYSHTLVIADTDIREDNIWESVASMLDIEVSSEEFKAIQLAHELEFDETVPHNTDHVSDTDTVTGFAVGIPPMYWAGMRAEQRLFSELASTGLPPAQLVDAYGSRVSYRVANKWAAKRGVSKSAVSQNRSKARTSLSAEYPRGTYPDGLGMSYSYSDDE